MDEWKFCSIDVIKSCFPPSGFPPIPVGGSKPEASPAPAVPSARASTGESNQDGTRGLDALKQPKAAGGQTASTAPKTAPPTNGECNSQLMSIKNVAYLHCLFSMTKNFFFSLLR